MKLYIPFAFILLATTSAFASDPCMEKQRRAARQALADETNIDLRSIRVVAVEEGFWSENVANNSGHDFITVRGKGIEYTYSVHARQIQASSDCKITAVERVERN